MSKWLYPEEGVGGSLAEDGDEGPTLIDISTVQIVVEWKSNPN